MGGGAGFTPPTARAARQIGHATLLPRLSAVHRNLGAAAPISGSEFALLADLGGLADAIAEVVQLGAADVAALDDLDLRHRRGVERERALDADAVAQLAHRVRLLQAAALTPDHVALEDLNPLLAALDHSDVDLELVTGKELGDVVAQRLVVNEVGRLHGVSLRSGPGSAVTRGLAKDTGPV